MKEEIISKLKEALSRPPERGEQVAGKPESFVDFKRNKPDFKFYTNKKDYL
jgi:hypothetical protein